MGMDNMDALCKCMFNIIETIVNIKHEEYVSKVIDVFQRTCSCLLDMKKINTRFPLLLSLLWAIYLHKPVYIFAHRAALLLKMQNVHLLFIITFVSLSTHILYFDEAKFSIKRFSLVYFTVSVVRQRNEYEIVTETRPIKTRLHKKLSLPRC